MKPFTKLILLLIVTVLSVKGAIAQNVLETFNSYWSVNGQITPLPVTYGPFTYNVTGSLNRATAPNGLSTGISSTTTLFTIKRSDNSNFQFVNFYADYVSASHTGTVTGYRANIAVTSAVNVTIGNAAPTLYDFSANAGFNNVDEVRFTGTALKFYLEDWTYNLTPAAAPTITTTGTLSAFTACTGTASSAQSFTVGGAGLTTGITITPPTGYQISTSATFASSVGTNAAPLVLAQSSGTVATTTVYARLASTATGTPSGNIALASTGATTQNIATSGSVGNTTTWTGTASNDWSAATNWSACVPSSSILVTIPAVTSPALAPVIGSGTFSLADLTVASGASLTLSTGVTLTMFGDTLSNNGTIGGEGKLSLGGTSVSTKLTGNGLINNLNLNASTGALVGAGTGDTLKVTGLLTFSSGTLTTNGKMVLKSSAAGTAVVGAATGTYISGLVTVERYIPSSGRKKFVLVTAPLSTNSPQTIYNSWQEGGAATVGYGTQITGATGTSTSNGFDATSASGLASIFSYNDLNAVGSKWVSVPNTNVSSFGLGKAYLLFVRGDRTVSPNSTTVGNTVLRAKGSLYQGALTFASSLLTAGANKYSLLGNAYASPIDWTLLTKTNLTAYFTVYDPNLGVFVTSDGTTKSPNVGNQDIKYKG